MTSTRHTKLTALASQVITYIDQQNTAPLRDAVYRRIRDYEGDDWSQFCTTLQEMRALDHAIELAYGDVNRDQYQVLMQRIHRMLRERE